jgi:hypothetical protein
VEDLSSSFTRPDSIYCIRGMLVMLSNERFLLVVNELEWQRQNKPARFNVGHPMMISEDGNLSTTWNSKVPRSTTSFVSESKINLTLSSTAVLYRPQRCMSHTVAVLGNVTAPLSTKCFNVCLSTRFIS